MPHPRRNGFEGMTYNQLLAVRERIDQLLAEKKAEHLANVRAQVAKVAHESGFELRDLFGANSLRPGRKKVAPKYQDPKNPANTWTGRGRPPRWLAELLKSKGTKKEDFLIAA